jgi:inorganic pyrophosphatase
MRFDRVPARSPNSQCVHVIVDTPAGSANKYKFDDELGVFRVSRVLPAGLIFPHDFGSVPGTCAADGDPLDVLVIGLPPTFPGCLVTVRLLGILHARQTEGGKTIRNDRLIGAGQTPVNQSAIRRLQDLKAQQLADIEHFFKSYNEAQGRRFNITGRGDRRCAHAALDRAIRSYRQSQG